MLNLQEKVYEKMNILCNYKEQIIYKNYQNNDKDNLEMVTIIVAMPHNRYRIYKGISYNSNISVTYFTIEEDMYLAMTSTLKINLGEVASNE
ncbi:hypothetical protein D9O40_17650 [Clostridium autoethanogenum]|uniref:Uncharacterized protein n=1 Tax=Clostridium autoethanogenum TaxID=84023 RepID=A0A3M0S793_9CLOT|nr:hypothetical protein [Clostridium autoethanogenum]RMC93781.1 hypothetical protein D9O40_17650 [Clostridium autoethanogenum]